MTNIVIVSNMLRLLFLVLFVLSCSDDDNQINDLPSACNVLCEKLACFGSNICTQQDICTQAQSQEITPACEEAIILLARCTEPLSCSELATSTQCFNPLNSFVVNCRSILGDEPLPFPLPN